MPLRATSRPSLPTLCDTSALYLGKIGANPLTCYETRIDLNPRVVSGGRCTLALEQMHQVTRPGGRAIV